MINRFPSFRGRLQIGWPGRLVACRAFQFLVINEHIFGHGPAPFKSNWRELTGGTGTLKVSGPETLTCKQKRFAATVPEQWSKKGASRRRR